MAQTCERTRRPPAGEKNLPPNEPCDHALGRSRGGFGSKVHLLTDSTGLPLAVAVSPGQAAEMRFVSAVLDQVRIGQPRGRPRQRPDALAGDRGYSFPSVRAWLREHHIEPVIPWRRDQLEHATRTLSFDRQAYRKRNAIERSVGWLKEARRIATRYEELAVHFLGALKLAMIRKHLAATLSDRP